MHGIRNDISPCRHCGLTPTTGPGGYPSSDPCLGILEGVTQACCGHGGYGICPAYVMISTCDPPGTFAGEAKGKLTTLRGRKALDFFKSRGVGPELVQRISPTPLKDSQS